MRTARQTHARSLWSIALTGWLGLGLVHPASSQTLDSFNPNANGIVSALAVQADGKIVVGGLFTQIGGQTRTRIARLQVDGTLDPTFSPAANDTVYSLAVQPDGKILVGGDLTTLVGFSRTAIGRLNTNGTLDTGFNMTVSAPPGFGYDLRIQSILVQPDGKIVVGGRNTISPPGGAAFTSGFNLRLNTNGTSDSSFVTTGGVNGPVATMAFQTDGKVILGGLFTSLRSQTRNRIGRLNADGTLDTNFNLGADGGVFALAVQADGKILVGGNFNTLGGQPRTNLARLNFDGTIDDNFTPAASGGGTPAVYSLALQADGKILVGGFFTSIAGSARANLARLNPGGTLDPTFTAQANNGVYGLSLLADGRILVGGQFSYVGGQFRNYVARFNNTESATQSLTDSGTSITWLRGGTSPEVGRTTFEGSTNLTNWNDLGAGIRITNGWQLTGLALPPGGRVRARGFAVGGGYNASTWFAETIGGACYITAQPIGRTNNASTVVSFTMGVNGSPPISYQWFKGASPLSDGGSVSGALSATLNFTGVLGGDAGGYSVIASNSFGSVTSVVAVLKVIDPIITSSLYTNYADAGNPVMVTIAATGTPPLSYQWYKDGTNLLGATTTSLLLSNVQRSDSGTYSVTVGNFFGSTNSDRMVLDVNLALPDFSFPALDGAIYGIAEQPDGKLVVSGNFTTIDGQPRRTIARFNSDRSLDENFTSPTNISLWPNALALLGDGRILVAGGFSLTQDSLTLFSLVRLHPSGDLDTGFVPQPDNSVLSLAEQADGKIVLGGSFSNLGGQPRAYLGRIYPDGTLDTNFNPGADFQVRSVLVQPDGKILVAGGFTYLAGQWRQGIGRLNTNGTHDSSFQTPGTDINYPGANQPVNCLALQADGKILLGGDFTILGGVARKYIGRLNPNGTLDTSFNPAPGFYANGKVYSLAVQADGKILVGGVFTSIGGKQRSYLARLLPNGQADPTFNAGIAHNQYVPVVSVGAAADGKTLVAGSFTSLGGIDQTNVARLNSTDPTTQHLSFNGSVITWLRSGPAPEVSRVRFETSTNGIAWSNLGDGTRISGGWRLNVMAASVKNFLRARGLASGGYYSGSSWPVESLIPVPPRILSDDDSFGFQTNLFGFNVAAVAGQIVIIEASTNLLNWSALATNLVGVGPFLFTDPNSSNAAVRFYRARLQ